MKRCLWILSALGPLSPQSVHACGGCVDYILDWYAPFAIPLSLVFAAWVVLRLTFWVLGKVTGSSIPLTYSKRANLPITIVAAIGLAIASGGSVLLPLLVIIVPSWFFTIYRAQKHAYAVQNRTTLHTLFIYGQWLTTAVIGVVIIYAYANFNSTARLIAKLDYASYTQPARERLAAKSEQVYPQLITTLENFTNTSRGKRYQYLNLMLVIKEINNPSIAPDIVKFFAALPYNENLYSGQLLLQTAGTLTTLDKQIAAEAIIAKLHELRRIEDQNHRSYRETAEGLLDNLEKIGPPTLVAGYRALGSPELGNELSAYKRWWAEGKSSPSVK